MAKKTKQLNPIIEDKTNIAIDKSRFEGLLDKFDIKSTKEENNETDSYFRAVLNNLMSSDNISLKTEYLNVNENFAGAKLEFLAKYSNMNYLKDFIKIFETKRVSLERKSRIEIIKALEKREEEIRQQQQRLLNSQMFGY